MEGWEGAWTMSLFVREIGLWEREEGRRQVDTVFSPRGCCGEGAGLGDEEAAEKTGAAVMR